MDTKAARYTMVLGENDEVVLQRSSRKLGKRDGEAKKTRDRRGWRGGRTHPPAVGAQSRPPGAARIRGGSIPPWPDRRCRPGESSTGSNLPGSSRAADRTSRKIRPGWTSSPSPSSSPSSRAPMPPSSPSPSQRTALERSSGAGAGVDAVEKTEKEEEEWERTVQKPRTDALYEVASE